MSVRYLDGASLRLTDTKRVLLSFFKFSPLYLCISTKLGKKIKKPKSLGSESFTSKFVSPENPTDLREAFPFFEDYVWLCPGKNKVHFIFRSVLNNNNKKDGKAN